MDRGTPLIRYTDRAGDERRMVIRMESASAVPGSSSCEARSR